MFVTGNNPVVPKLLIENQRVEKNKWELTNLNLTDAHVSVVTKISSVVLVKYKNSHFTPYFHNYW